MSEMKHTPGPWTAVDAPGAGIEIYGDVRATMGERFTELVEIFGTSSCNPPRFQIAYERWVQFPKREWNEMQQANARLIAAAPELLEALKWYVENDDVMVMDGNEFWLEGKETAKKAIAKATGGAQ